VIFSNETVQTLRPSPRSTTGPIVSTDQVQRSRDRLTYNSHCAGRYDEKDHGPGHHCVVPPKALRPTGVARKCYLGKDSQDKRKNRNRHASHVDGRLSHRWFPMTERLGGILRRQLLSHSAAALHAFCDYVVILMVVTSAGKISGRACRIPERLSDASKLRGRTSVFVLSKFSLRTARHLPRIAVLWTEFAAQTSPLSHLWKSGITHHLHRDL
jgi:hypothetical protein